jgi:electron transfer flavoprotein beta subunit
VKAVALEDGGLRCEQEVPGGRDVYRVPLPAVVTVKEGLNLPRYPSVPGRLRAKKKPVEARSPERGQQGVEKVRLVVPVDEGSQTEVLGRGAEAAPAVVELLGRVGVL